MSPPRIPSIEFASLMAVCKAFVHWLLLFFFGLVFWDNALNDDAVVVSLHIYYIERDIERSG